VDPIYEIFCILDPCVPNLKIQNEELDFNAELITSHASSYAFLKMVAMK